MPIVFLGISATIFINLLPPSEKVNGDYFGNKYSGCLLKSYPADAQ
jgi:hypothetical protein